MLTIFDRVGQEVSAGAVSHGVYVIELPAVEVLPAAQRLQQLGFDMLLDVTAVDWPQRLPRFDVVWHFYSTAHRVRVRIKAPLSETDPRAPSMAALYGSAHYAERECHEMFGIAFDGNDDLRPILLYEGFVGYPLRKDYPKTLEQPLVPYREGVQ